MRRPQSVEHTPSGSATSVACSSCDIHPQSAQTPATPPAALSPPYSAESIPHQTPASSPEPPLPPTLVQRPPAPSPSPHPAGSPQRSSQSSTPDRKSTRLNSSH